MEPTQATAEVIKAATYKLANFSSLLEVSVALHLAYSLIYEVSHATSRRYELHSEHLKRYFADLDEDGQSSLRPMIAELDLELFKLNRRLEPLVRWLSRISVVVAVYSICLLAHIGFSPNGELTIQPLLSALLPAMLPFPLFLFISYAYGVGHSIATGEKSFSALTEYSRLVTAGHLRCLGRYIGS